MKTLLKLTSIFVLLVASVGCNDDDGETLTEFTITSISPESGIVGTEITITGSNFPTAASEVSLTFGGAPATISSITGTRIVAQVPPGATSGEVNITTNGFTRTASPDFRVLSNLISDTVENLFAPQSGGRGEPIGGPFTKFSFETGEETTSDTEWDIAFRGTSIAVNGGTVTGTNEEPERTGDAAASIENGIFSEITSADGLSFEQDTDGVFAIPAGSDMGWYNYNPATNVVSPIPGKVLVFRTHDGKFAKVEILSYYENAPANPDGFADASRYYTFNYVYNPNAGETSLAP